MYTWSRDRGVTFCLSRTRACLYQPSPSGGRYLPVSSSMVLRSFSLQIKARSGQSGTLPQWQCLKAAGLKWPLSCRLNLSSLKEMGKCSTRKNTILSLRAWCCFWQKPMQKDGNPRELHYNSHTQSSASSQMSSFIFPVWRLLPQVSACLGPIFPWKHLSLSRFREGWLFSGLCSLMGVQKHRYSAVCPAFFLLYSWGLHIPTSVYPWAATGSPLFVWVASSHLIQIDI